MSGGHYDYAYGVVDNFAVTMLTMSEYDYDTNDYIEINADDYDLRLRISQHLVKVAKLMHDIEWCDSGDTGREDCVKAMKEFLSIIKEE